MPRQILLLTILATLGASALRAQEAAPTPTAAEATPAPAAADQPVTPPVEAPAAAVPSESPAGFTLSPDKAADSVLVPETKPADDTNPLFDTPLPGTEKMISPQPGGYLPDTSREERSIKRSKTAVVNDELKERIRFRQAKTRASNEPTIQQLWEDAMATTTDPERRVALKKYYDTLYARIAKIDPTLKSRIAANRGQAAAQARARAAKRGVKQQEPSPTPTPKYER